MEKFILNFISSLELQESWTLDFELAVALILARRVTPNTD